MTCAYHCLLQGVFVAQLCIHKMCRSSKCSCKNQICAVVRNVDFFSQQKHYFQLRVQHYRVQQKRNGSGLCSSRKKKLEMPWVGTPFSECGRNFKESADCRSVSKVAAMMRQRNSGMNRIRPNERTRLDAAV